MSALILGLRPTVAHVYGVDKRFSVDKLNVNGLAAWRAALGMLADDFADPSVDLTSTETWLGQWVLTEIERETLRWSDASTVLELLALSLGPVSLDPTHLRPESFWATWMQNLHEQRSRIDTGRTSISGDSVDLAAHCMELARSHGAPDGMIELLDNIVTVPRPVLHQPEVFRPLSTPAERLQLSAILASAYSVGPNGCAAAEARLLEQRPPLLATCTRAS